MITHKTLIRKDVQLTREQASNLLSHWLGSKTSCRELQQLDGGICSAVFLLEFDRTPGSAVVKLQKPLVESWGGDSEIASHHKAIFYVIDPLDYLAVIS